MIRYIIKKDNQWKIVTRKYKRASKIFDTRSEAIIYACNMETTTSIIVQGEDNKFTKLTQEEIRTLIRGNKSDKFPNGREVKYVPRYIYVQTENKENIRYKLIPILLTSLIIVFTILAIIFVTLYFIDWKDIK